MKRFLITTIAVFCGLGLWSLASYFSPVSIVGGSDYGLSGYQSLKVSYVDMVSVMLTGVTIILAALGFVIAVLAFVGWNSIRAIAEASAREVVRESITDGGKLHDVVRKETRAIIRYSGVESVDTEFDESDAGEEDKNGA